MIACCNLKVWRGLSGDISGAVRIALASVRPAKPRLCRTGLTYGFGLALLLCGLNGLATAPAWAADGLPDSVPGPRPPRNPTTKTDIVHIYHRGANLVYGNHIYPENSSRSIQLVDTLISETERKLGIDTVNAVEIDAKSHPTKMEAINPLYSGRLVAAKRGPVMFPFYRNNTWNPFERIGEVSTQCMHSAPVLGSFYENCEIRQFMFSTSYFKRRFYSKNSPVSSEGKSGTTLDYKTEDVAGLVKAAMLLPRMYAFIDFKETGRDATGNVVGFDGLRRLMALFNRTHLTDAQKRRIVVQYEPMDVSKSLYALRRSKATGYPFGNANGIPFQLKLILRQYIFYPCVFGFGSSGVRCAINQSTGGAFDYVYAGLKNKFGQQEIPFGRWMADAWRDSVSLNVGIDNPGNTHRFIWGLNDMRANPNSAFRQRFRPLFSEDTFSSLMLLYASKDFRIRDKMWVSHWVPRREAIIPGKTGAAALGGFQRDGTCCFVLDPHRRSFEQQFPEATHMTFDRWLEDAW